MAHLQGSGTAEGPQRNRKPGLEDPTRLIRAGGKLEILREVTKIEVLRIWGGDCTQKGEINRKDGPCRSNRSRKLVTGNMVGEVGMA